ncbi:MAG: PqqD family protein [Acidimicrobiales bacterium]
MTTATDGSGLFVRDHTLLWRRVGGRRLVVLSPSGELRELEGSGPVLWELLAEPVAYQELVAVLGELFGEAAARIDADVAPVLAELEASGLVRRVAP